MLGGGDDFMTGARLGVYDQSPAAAQGEPMVMFLLSPLMQGEAQAALPVVQPRGESQPSLAELREFLSRHLSGFWLPRSVTYVEEIPRNGTGKANYPRAKEMVVGNPAVAEAGQGT